MCARKPSAATIAGIADQLRDVRPDARRDREQDPAAWARPEQAVGLVADELFVHLQGSTVRPARLVCSCRWPRTWSLGRQRQMQSSLNGGGKRMDVEAGRHKCSVERLFCGCDFACLV
jgi:hypothetical protein